jgi:hypothetical protein
MIYWLISGQALLLGLPHQKVPARQEFKRATTQKDKFDKGLTITLARSTPPAL